jgi:hypothetical protein
MHSLQHKNNCLLQGTTISKKLTTTIGKQKDKGNDYNQKGGIKLTKQVEIKIQIVKKPSSHS